MTGKPYFLYEVYSEGYGILKDDGTLDVFQMYPLLEDRMTETDVLRGWIFPGTKK